MVNFDRLQALCKALSSIVRTETGNPALSVYAAGGAPRDLLLGRQDKIRDVDLWAFVPEVHLEKVRKAVEVSGQLGKLLRNVGGVGADLGRDGDIWAIDYYQDEALELNLIFLAKPVQLKTLLWTFDFSVNQAGVNQAGPQTTLLFRQDTEKKLLRVTRKDSADRHLKRLEKMTSYFPGWAVFDRIATPPKRRRAKRYRLYD